MEQQFVQGDSLFNRLNKITKQYDYLIEDIETEVIIAGGGVTGALLAYYFTKNNVKCVVLEKGRIAHGSTGITTSLLQYELDGKVNELLEYTSKENVIESYSLGQKALQEIDDFITAYGNKCQYEKKDALLYTSKKLEFDEIKAEYEIRKENGFDVEFIDENNNPFSFDLKAGVYSKNAGAQFDPYQFTHQLLEVAEEKGARIYENTEIVKVNYTDDKAVAVTQYENRVSGKILIVATGYNTSIFTNRQFGTKTTTYNIATKPVADFNGWYNKVLIKDNNIPYNYYRTTYDNRIIAGGGDIPFIPNIFDEKAADEKYSILENRIKNMFSNIEDIEVEYKYCGCFASTDDNLGFLGKDPENLKLWYCLGYGANGILFAVLGGMMLSRLYLGEEDKALKLFRIDRFDQNK